MDTAKIGEFLGTYRVRQAETSRQRRVTLWITVVMLALLLGWGAFRFLRDGAEGALTVATYVVVLAAVHVLAAFTRRWWMPQTRLNDAGVQVMTGLTGGRRTASWKEIIEVQVAHRFTGHPVLVLRDGAHLELPGVPAGVAEHLRAACIHTEGLRSALPRTAATPLSVQAEEGWEGPFQRG